MNDEQQQQSGIRKALAERKRPVIIIGVLLLIGLGVVIYWLLTRGKETTDDAQVQGHLVPISSRVPGHVALINVNDNQLVSKGYLLVQLDPKDYEDKVRRAEADLAAKRAQAAASGQQVSVVGRTAPSAQSQAEAAVKSAAAAVNSAQTQVRSAQAQLAAANAQAMAAYEVVVASASDIDVAVEQVQAAKAVLTAAQANVTSAQAQAKKAASDFRRFKQLYAEGATSKHELERFEATNTSAQAELDYAKQQVESAKAALGQAESGRTRATAALKRAKAQYKAAQDEAARAKAGIGTAKAEVSRAEAMLKQSEASLSGTQTVPEQISISKSQDKAAQAAIKQSVAQLQEARLQLQYTTIKAPVEGVVGQKSVQLGQYVQPGQMLMAVVPLRDVWVVANFKETQTDRMRRGQRATFTVDAYPGRTFRGRVDSIAPSTVAKTSLLPPENATGNFVKVVQRIPVKIVLDQELPKGVTLRPGQNVVATVYL